MFSDSVYSFEDMEDTMTINIIMAPYDENEGAETDSLCSDFSLDTEDRVTDSQSTCLEGSEVSGIENMLSRRVKDKGEGKAIDEAGEMTGDINSTNKNGLISNVEKDFAVPKRSSIETIMEKYGHKAKGLVIKRKSDSAGLLKESKGKEKAEMDDNKVDVKKDIVPLDDCSEKDNPTLLEFLRESSIKRQSYIAASKAHTENEPKVHNAVRIPSFVLRQKLGVNDVARNLGIDSAKTVDRAKYRVLTASAAVRKSKPKGTGHRVRSKTTVSTSQARPKSQVMDKKTVQLLSALNESMKKANEEASGSGSKTDNLDDGIEAPKRYPSTNDALANKQVDSKEDFQDDTEDPHPSKLLNLPSHIKEKILKYLLPTNRTFLPYLYEGGKGRVGVFKSRRPNLNIIAALGHHAKDDFLAANTCDMARNIVYRGNRFFFVNPRLFMYFFETVGIHNLTRLDFHKNFLFTPEFLKPRTSSVEMSWFRFFKVQFHRLLLGELVYTCEDGTMMIKGEKYNKKKPLFPLEAATPVVKKFKADEAELRRQASIDAMMGRLDHMIDETQTETVQAVAYARANVRDEDPEMEELFQALEQCRFRGPDVAVKTPRDAITPVPRDQAMEPVRAEDSRSRVAAHKAPRIQTMDLGSHFPDAAEFFNSLKG